jgi:ribosome-associated protein YbcJ (S4-like RNA binding protein)
MKWVHSGVQAKLQIIDNKILHRSSQGEKPQKIDLDSCMIDAAMNDHV